MRATDLYITFYRIHGGLLSIYNEYSFLKRKKGTYKDVFISLDLGIDELGDILSPLLSEAKNIYVSVLSYEMITLLYPLIDERWIIGGNIWYQNIKEIDEGFTPSMLRELGAKEIHVPLELYFNPKGELSTVFEYYFKDLVESIPHQALSYSVSLGYGCHWRRCTFCIYSLSGMCFSIRKNISSVISQIPLHSQGKTTDIHTCLPAIPGHMLGEVLSAGWNSHHIPVLFIRADEESLRALSSLKGSDVDCRNRKFSIGMEILSDSALNILNKGTTVNYILGVTELILSQGGMVELSIMTGYSFLTPQIIDEAQIGYRRLKKIFKQYKGPENYLWIVNYGDVEPPVSGIPMDEIIKSAKDSLQVAYNATIKEFVIDTGITIF